jgi:hypothetical protein
MTVWVLSVLSVVEPLAAGDRSGSGGETVSAESGKSRTSETPGAALYWFDLRKISDAGHAFYGAYVYEQLLPEFAPSKQRGGRNYAFSDGDYLPTGPVTVPTQGAAEAKVLESALALGSSAYVVAVYGYEGGPFADLDRVLKSGGTTGYLGMTTWPEASLEEYLSLRRRLSLPVAFKLEGVRFRRADFAFLGDQRLRAMGFEPVR